MKGQILVIKSELGGSEIHRQQNVFEIYFVFVLRSENAHSWGEAAKAKQSGGAGEMAPHLATLDAPPEDSD